VKLYEVLILSASIAIAITALVAAVTDSTKLWIAVTMLGSEAAYVLISILIYVALKRELGARCMTSVLVTAAAVLLLKELIGLPRPPQELWRVAAHGPGFPSGHAATTTAFWSTLALQRSSVLPLALSIVLTVSLSRIALGVHYIHDVVGGIVLGFAISMLNHVAWNRSRFATVFASATSVAMAFATIAVTRDSWSIDASMMVAGFALAMPLYIYVDRRVGEVPSLGLAKRLVYGIAVSMVVAILVLAIEKYSPSYAVMPLTSCVAIVAMLSPLALHRSSREA